MKCTQKIRQKSDFGGAFLMSKKIYTTDIKLQVVKYVVDEKHSIGEAVEHFKIPYQSMRMWIKHYEHIGIAGLAIKNQKYTGAFKVSVVKYMYENKLSLVATAVHFSIPDHTIVRDWKKIYDNKGPLYLLQEQRGRSKKSKMKSKKAKKIKEKNSLTEKELLKRIEYLETENAYLKKLNALIQEKEKSKKEIK